MPIPPREECKFPGARAGHSSATRSFLPRKKVFDLDRGRGQGGANKKVMKRGETNSLAERNNIRDSWKRRGPLIAIAAEKRRERTARGGPGHRSIGRNCA